MTLNKAPQQNQQQPNQQWFRRLPTNASTDSSPQPFVPVNKRGHVLLKTDLISIIDEALAILDDDIVLRQ